MASLAPTLIKVFKSPQGQKAIQTGLRLGLQGAKKGFARVQQRRAQRPARGGQRRRRGPARPRETSDMQEVLNMPTQVNVSVANVNRGGINVNRTEMTLSVMSATDAAELKTRVTRIPLYPTNPDVAPSAEGAAEAFQFYRFRHFRYSYRPRAGADVIGNVAVAFVASYDSALKCIDVDSTAVTGNTTKFNPYNASPKIKVIMPSDLNTQYLKEGYSVHSDQDVDDTDPRQVQGYLVIARGGAAAGLGDPTEWGQIQLNYAVECIKPQVADSGAATAFGLQVIVNPAAVTWPVNINAESEAYHKVNPRWTTEMDGADVIVNYRSKRPYVVEFSATATGAGDVLTSLTPNADSCVIDPIGVHDTQDTTQIARYVVRPLMHTSSFTLVAGLNTASRVGLYFHTIPGSDVEWMKTHLPPP